VKYTVTERQLKDIHRAMRVIDAEAFLAMDFERDVRRGETLGTIAESLRQILLNTKRAEIC